MSAVFLRELIMKKENPVLNIYKAAACFFVVAAHTRFPGRFGGLLFCYGAYAVALFFAVAGRYLIPNDVDPSAIGRICRKKALKTLRVTLIITLVYTLYSLIYNLLSGMTFHDWIHEKYTLSELVRLLVFNSGRIIYDGAVNIDHLWFLFAMIYVFIVISFFGKHAPKLSGPLSAFLLVCLFAGQLLKKLHPFRLFGISISEWYTLRNWLFLGLPFMLFGMWYSQNSGKFQKIMRNRYTGLFIFFAGMAVTCAEYLIFDDIDAYFGAFIMVIGSFLHSDAPAREDSESCKKRLTGLLVYTGKNLSAGIYYWHIMVLSVVTAVVFYFIRPVWGNIVYEWLKPFIVLGLTIAVCLIIRCFRKRPGAPSRT